jgi:hypothetical protein
LGDAAFGCTQRCGDFLVLYRNGLDRRIAELAALKCADNNCADNMDFTTKAPTSPRFHW